MHANSFLYYSDIGVMKKENVPVIPVSLVYMSSNNTPAPFVATSTTISGVGYEAYRAFDGDKDTGFRTTSSATLSSPEWLSVDLGSPNVCNGISIRGRTDAFADQTPRDYSLQGSNDNITWTEVFRQVGMPSSIGDLKTFYFNNIVGYRYYRLFVRSATSTTRINVNQLDLLYNIDPLLNYKFIDAVPLMTADIQNGITISASGYVSSPTAEPPFQAFNGVLANVWTQAVAATTASPVWLMIDFGAGVTKKIVKYRIGARGANFDQMPKDWSLEGSNDGINFTNLGGFRANWTWTAFQVREWEIPNSDFYRYYRIVITANNGHVGYTGLAQLQLSEI